MDEDDYEISHETPPEVTEKCAMIQEMVGCGYVKAWQALMHNDQDIVLAVDALLTKPVVAGEKYLPKKPVIDHGLSEEQKERCDRGRWLQDQVNAVFSVAHSKTQTQPVPPALEAPPVSKEPVARMTSSRPLSSEPASQPDTDGKTPLPTQQSEPLQ
jgi:hypothetical protein